MLDHHLRYIVVERPDRWSPWRLAARHFYFTPAKDDAAARGAKKLLAMVVACYHDQASIGLAVHSLNSPYDRIPRGHRD